MQYNTSQGLKTQRMLLKRLNRSTSTYSKKSLKLQSAGTLKKFIGWFPHPKYFEHPTKDCWRSNRRNSELNKFTIPTMAIWHYFHLVIEPDELDRSWQICRIMKISISHFLWSVRCLTAWKFRLLDTTRLTITFILNFNLLLTNFGCMERISSY